MAASYEKRSYLSRVILCDKTKAGGNGDGLEAILTSVKKNVLVIAQAEQNNRKRKIAIGGKASSGACA
jgi:hypothetical protein